jgi:hypothetical protein
MKPKIITNKTYKKIETKNNKVRFAATQASLLSLDATIMI